MQTIFLDFETYYDDTYTLKKLTTEEYVRDPRFEALMVAVIMPDGASLWVGQENIKAFLASIDWTQTAVVCHHAQFDCLILAHHYQVYPRFIFDTLSMARVVIGNHLSKSLESLARHFGTELKSVPYGMFKGRQWVNIYPHERQQLGDGAVGDCRITRDIFVKLAQGFPAEEFEIIDMTVRMFTEPCVWGDINLLADTIMDEQQRKSELLQQLGVNEDDLQSADRFTKLLENMGVEIEYKTGKNGAIPAIAKTDDFMKALLADSDETISTLAEARLAVRSTLQESRAGRMLSMAQRGPMCIYLAYGAAHTTRFGGGDSLNWQNLPRVNPEKPRSGNLRRSIAAPAGYSIVSPDASQIECRIVNYVAGQGSVLEAFAAGRDVYAEAASRFYGQPINKKDHPLQRQLFKQVELGCGYGLGAERFVVYAKSGAGGPPIYLEAHEAQAAIQFYRDEHPSVVRLWSKARHIVPHLAGYGAEGVALGPCRVHAGYIEGPNGLRLHYPGLDFNWSDGENHFPEWSYQTRNGRTRLYGGKLIENIVQFLARIVVTQAWLRIRRGCGLRPWLTTHDDLAYIVRDEQAIEANAYMINEMKREPEWMPGIPLDAEGEPAKRYVK